MDTTVSVSGCLLSALIHEDEASSGLLIGDKSVVTAFGDDTGESREEEHFNITSYTCDKFFDNAGNCLVDLEEDVVGWWISRRAPPVPSLRDAAVQASLGPKAPLLLSICVKDELNLRFAFSRNLDRTRVNTRMKTLKHDTKAELRIFHPVPEWSAFSARQNSLRDLVTSAFTKDRQVLQKLLDQLNIVEAEADRIENTLLPDAQ